MPNIFVIPQVLGSCSLIPAKETTSLIESLASAITDIRDTMSAAPENITSPEQVGGRGWQEKWVDVQLSLRRYVPLDSSTLNQYLIVGAPGHLTRFTSSPTTSATAHRVSPNSPARSTSSGGMSRSSRTSNSACAYAFHLCCPAAYHSRTPAHTQVIHEYVRSLHLHAELRAAHEKSSAELAAERARRRAFDDARAKLRAHRREMRAELRRAKEAAHGQREKPAARPLRADSGESMGA